MTRNESEPETPLVSTLVVRKVAEKEGIDPIDLDQQLDDVVNADALDRLLTPKANGVSRKGGKVVFTYYGYRITIESPQRVTVENQ